MKKYILPIVIGVFLFVALFASPAKALTVAELQTQIQALLQQINVLQQQLNQQQGNQGVAWCHTFSKNLRVGDGGLDGGLRSANDVDNDVSALKQALSKQGLYDLDIDQPGTAGSSMKITYFNEQLASAVVEFQEKYADEILKPYRLRRGTGYVGVSTRAKLNKLYGCANKPIEEPQPTCQNLWWYDSNNKVCSQKQFCGVYMYLGLKTFSTQSACQSDLNPTTVQPTITVTSPKGGEVWEIGKTYTITWTSSNLPSNALLSIGINGDGQTSSMAGGQIATNISASNGSYSWTVPSLLGENLAGKKYSVYATCLNCSGNVGYSSENYFTISAAAVACTDSDNGLDYYTYGNVKYSSEILYDKCMGSQLWEYSCENGVKKTNYYTCPGGCENGVCKKTTAFLIGFVNNKVSYPAGGTISFSVNAIKSTRYPATPSEGFNVKATLLETGKIVNAVYNTASGFWDVSIPAPSEVGKTYNVKAVFYCANPSLDCAEGQLEKTHTFYTYQTSGSISSLEIIQSQLGTISQSIANLLKQLGL